MKISIIGASGKLGQYLVQHALDRGYEVVGVCREKSLKKLDRFEGRIAVVPGATNNPDVIRRAVAGCDAVLVVLVPWGGHQYSSERPGQYSITQSRVRALYSPAGGTSLLMARTNTQRNYYGK